jgi:glutamine synthetase
MVRIPHAARREDTRLELRCPDATGNVYLQFAIVIFMGLAGIAGKEDPGQPDIGSTYKREVQPRVFDERYLPRDIFPALMEAEDSAFMEESLGAQLFSNYMRIKTLEWESFRTTITDLEHRKYLPI